MIISENNKPKFSEFRELMRNTDLLLNSDASSKEEYYSKRNGTELEVDVYEALNESAKGTKFENTIQLVSGASFPDIVANKFYGVEVKSTNKNHWHSVGSSILESTRNQDVERIFLTFGKLGSPVEFRSRPYEECLSGISVTHYPRYQIDMTLEAGETIFDKMGIAYDELRKMDNPVAPVSKYYRSLLKPGESLWWAAGDNVENTVAPATVRLWSALSHDAKMYYTVRGYALFPETLSTIRDQKKYQRYALWLATECGIINTCIRDSFSAGGQVEISTVYGKFEKMPAAYGKVAKHKDLIIETILTSSEDMLKEYWGVKVIKENRILQWCELIASSVDAQLCYHQVLRLLKGIFVL